MRCGHILDCVGKTPLVELTRHFAGQPTTVLAKLELLNPGSVKDRPARYMIEQGLRDGTITLKTHLLESTSGNFGIALAMAARVYGLSVTIVVDPKITPMNLRILELLGATVDMVTTPDENGGYLKTRICRVHELLDTTPHVLWTRQYSNDLNWRAHYEGEGNEILADLDGPVDVLVLAVSTTGTIMGIARRLREAFPALRVVAVDAAGSIIFGATPAPRELPGIGSSRVPELLRPEEIDEVIYVDDLEAVSACRRLLMSEAIFAGGSSGSVIAGIEKLIPTLAPGSRIVTLLPDRGDRYLDTVYNDAWVAKLQASHIQRTIRLVGGQVIERAA